MRRALLIPCLALALILMFAGCVDERGRPSGDYLINEHGCLSLECPACTAEETSFPAEEGYSVTRVVFHTPDRDVYALAAFPDAPVAGFVLAPGAGVKKE